MQNPLMQTIEALAKEKGIAIYARATAQPPVETGREIDGTIVRKFAPRQPGSVASVVSERDVLDHSISVAAAATAITRDGYDYSKQTLGTLAIPATTPAPAGPDAPAPAGPASPAAAGADGQPAATPSSATAARSATEVSTTSA